MPGRRTHWAADIRTTSARPTPHWRALPFNADTPADQFWPRPVRPNYEPTTSTALPAVVQAEHGGFNENETHVPLLVVHSSLTPGVNRAPVTLSQIAPTILTLLGLDPSALQAVALEGTKTLPGVPTKQNNGLGNNN